MSGDTRRGFGRLVEAGKGVGKLFAWLAVEDARVEAEEAAARAELPHERYGSDAREGPELAGACMRPQAPGWRCVVEGPHVECLLERTA